MDDSSRPGAILKVLVSTWPNLISLARLLSLPLIIWLILVGNMKWAFVACVAAGISDLVDGFTARILKTPTQVGAYLDPLADKVLLIGLYATLGYSGYIPAWLVIMIIFRDVLIIGGVMLLFLFEKKFAERPLMISKINTFLQIATMGWVLWQLAYVQDIPYITQGLIIATAATTVMSGVAYVVLWLQYFSASER